MMMNEYLTNLQVCIDSKLQSFAMEEGFSIVDLHILYHHQISLIERIYAIPSEHYSKIMSIAFKNTIDKIYRVKED